MSTLVTHRDRQRLLIFYRRRRNGTGMEAKKGTFCYGLKRTYLNCNLPISLSIFYFDNVRRVLNINRILLATYPALLKFPMI
jgi:hypothetical protein